MSIELSVPAYGFMQSQPILYKSSQTALQSAFSAYAWSALTLGDKFAFGDVTHSLIR